MGGILFHLFILLAGTILSCKANVPPVWDVEPFKILKEGFNENTPVGTFLTQLSCSDADGDRIDITVFSGSAVNVDITGRVTLARPLDFELKGRTGYDISFKCRDFSPIGIPNSEGVIVRTQISVDDYNDNPPLFNTDSVEGYSYLIPEDAKVGTVLLPPLFISDRDRSDNAELRRLFLICNSDNATLVAELPDSNKATCEKFEITFVQVRDGYYNATLYLKNTLDYESRATYSSMLVAMDGTDQVDVSLSTTINIQINVQDAQDRDPIFTNIGDTTSVREGERKGVRLPFAIKAQDGDLDAKTPVKLSIIEDEKDAFSLSDTYLLDSNTGVYGADLVVNNALDREAISGAYYFTVKVTELDATTLEETTATATATYSVTITDINDETPEFEQPSYSINVTEIPYTPESVQITGLRIVCTDADEFSNARYRVRIISQPNEDVFSISPDTSFVGTASMFLSVDKTEFADYDKPQYRTQVLVLEAKELNDNPKSSSTTVTILLTDVNDNSPIFDQQTYEIDINENLDEFPLEIANISATDIDSGSNGKIHYSLEQGANEVYFSLNPLTGVLFLQKAVDFESIAQYVFLVKATDQGTDSKSSQVQVIINVLNYNDEAPVFKQALYRTAVNEESLEFLTPVVVQATDDEVGTVRVTYKIADDQFRRDSFRLDRDTGELTLQKPLNFQDTTLDENDEPSGSFDLIIEATDNTFLDPPQISEVLVTILIIDKNNFGPVLEPKEYYKTLSELADPGTVVAEINGTDKDVGDFGKISYRLDSGGFDNFVVDPDSGVVTVNDPQQFDYDIAKSYSVKIKASDGGSPHKSAVATVIVTITDANNKIPEFVESIYTGSVDEERPINFVILTVFARDGDSSKELRYRMLKNTIKARDGNGNELTPTSSYDYQNAIAVDETSGDVYINNKLDKSIISEINFKIEVEDMAAESPGQTHNTQVALIVTGPIEDGIIFDVIEQNFMNEGEDTTFSVATLLASDPLNPQDNLRFFKTSGSDDFRISVSGVVKPTRKLDYESDPQIYRLGVRALTNDGQRSATATLTINILDVNDNAPEFDEPEYHAVIDEDALYPMEVINIRAQDKDSTSYGPIIYRIGGGVGSDDFILFPTNGDRVLVLVARNRQLDFNRRSFYELDIVATDNPNREVAGHQESTSVKLKISVRDKNNNIPIFQFDETYRKMAIAESAPTDSSVGTIIATDADFGRNGDVTYSLQPIAGDPDSLEGVKKFRIIPSLGTIVVERSLLGFGGKQYSMKVRATDGGDPSNSANLQIQIAILSTEIDDGSPFWDRPSEDYETFINEEESNVNITDVDFFQVTARTGDTIRYSLSEFTTYDDSFSIDAETGQLSVRKRLDRERKQDYILVVYAGDTRDPQNIRSGRQITIRLRDKNDNEASFMNRKNYPQCGELAEGVVKIEVRENEQKNKIVHTVSACDPDGPDNNEITYRPYKDNANCDKNYNSSKIKIQPDGRLTIGETIDYESEKEFYLCVKADSVKPANVKDPPMDSVRFIKVEVLDENDNGPKFSKDIIYAVMNIRPIAETVVTLTAVDPDGPKFNSIIYSITNVLYHEDGRSRVVNDLFGIELLDSVSPTKYYYEAYTNGYFEVEVLASDRLNPLLNDTQQIMIFVYRPFQTIKVVLDQSPSVGYNTALDLQRELNDEAQKRYKFVFLQASENSDDDEKTDVCFAAIDVFDSRVLQKPSAIGALSNSEFQTILSKYNYFDTGACFPSKSSEDRVKWRRLWWVLVALAIFIFVCSLIFIVLISILYRRYKRYMKSKKMYLVPQ